MGYNGGVEVAERGSLVKELRRDQRFKVPFALRKYVSTGGVIQSDNSDQTWTWTPACDATPNTLSRATYAGGGDSAPARATYAGGGDSAPARSA
jgi:hypothetical protein